MNKVTCPNCNESFSLDDADFASIVTQVRTAEFDAELHKRMEEAEKNNKTAIELAEAKTAKKMADEAEKLRTEVAALNAKINATETEKQLAIKTAVEKAEKERDELKSGLEKAELEKKLGEQSLKDKFQTQLKDRDDEIERLREMKARLSTKMVGETLEKHCENEFNAIRAAAFPNAEFEKDNEIIDKTKGDYTFRDFTLDGTEITSIMFEMKNEMDEGISKKTTNESHLEKLDKDRKKKDLEYAVLVTTLEPDNELYNRGIVDMSHKFPKMYVVRPQFFIPIITLLRNSALNAVDYKAELEAMKDQQIEIVDFEVKLGKYKNYVTGKYEDASKKFQLAIKGIDDAIKDLEATKARLLGSEKDLRLASEYGDKMTIRSLTWGNKTMKAKFDDLAAGGAGAVES